MSVADSERTKGICLLSELHATTFAGFQELHPILLQSRPYLDQVQSFYAECKVRTLFYQDSSSPVA